jgi:hypothetical protein
VRRAWALAALWIGSSVGTAGFVAAEVLDELHRDVCRVVLGPYAEAPLGAHVARVLAGRYGEDVGHRN